MSVCVWCAHTRVRVGAYVWECERVGVCMVCSREYPFSEMGVYE